LAKLAPQLKADFGCNSGLRKYTVSSLALLKISLEPMEPFEIRPSLSSNKFLVFEALGSVGLAQVKGEKILTSLKLRSGPDMHFLSLIAVLFSQNPLQDPKLRRSFSGQAEKYS
jgi:hypothetical protein